MNSRFRENYLYSMTALFLKHSINASNKGCSVHSPTMAQTKLPPLSLEINDMVKEEKTDTGSQHSNDYPNNTRRALTSLTSSDNVKKRMA